MKNSNVTIKTNQAIARDTWEMVLQVPEVDACQLGNIRPGQFLNLKLQGRYLRRPISICDWDPAAGTITIVYKTVGRGTEDMSRMSAGERLDVLWPLGNGYKLPESPAQDQENGKILRPLLIGGGAGVPPMFGLCRKLAETGAEPVVILGFRSAEDAFYEERFRREGARVIVTTEDGSTGQKGFVTGPMKELDYDAFFACGPEPMLRAVCESAPEDIPGWLSFEERMGCGFGACMGCSCRTKYGSKRICKDGPVLERSEIIW